MRGWGYTGIIRKMRGLPHLRKGFLWRESVCMCVPASQTLHSSRVYGQAVFLGLVVLSVLSLLVLGLRPAEGETQR